MSLVRLPFTWICLLIFLAGIPSRLSAQVVQEQPVLADLGRALFFDTNLSVNGAASCASCHDPSAAYSDPRRNNTSVGRLPGAVSLGADGQSVGIRNSPALTYVALTPEFQQRADGSFSGGFFLDGRADDLAAQALGPLLNHLELALPDRQTLASRLRENAMLQSAVGQLISDKNFADDDSLIETASEALAAFQRSTEFMAFDSRYDRYLAGDYQLTPVEAVGRELFFSELTNCSECHLANRDQRSRREPFTNFEYHNVGTPRNEAVADLQQDPSALDLGLAVRPEASAADRGKFRVPSLRNVAVTAPYMHNGVFATLETAVLFYGHHLAGQSVASINPETGQPWRGAEVSATVEQRRLMVGQPLDPTRVGQLVAFLKTLTDARYEHLLMPD